jgi:hypothetical protein
MTRIQWFRSLALGAALCVASNVTAAAASAPDDAVAAFTEVSGALLGLDFDARQRELIRQHIDAYWQRQQREPMQSVLNTREFAQRLRQQPPALRAVAVSMSRPDTLLSLQADARRGDALSAFLLAEYAKAHPPLAPAREGGLALTRDSVDGQLALAHFIATEVHRQNAPPPDARVREQAYRAAAARHASLSAQEQVQLARAPGEAARLRFGWDRASPMDRLLGRSEMGGALTAQEQSAVKQYLAGLNAQIANMRAQHQQTMLGGALRAMRQNSETIMGRGTVWNPATNRWEQQGGIVTEYNGTVRVP